MRKILNSVKHLLKQIPLFGTIWFFPIIVTIALLLLTVLKIHGSSIGVYDVLLDSPSSNENLLGSSRIIRSDEWFVNTPFILSQKENGFPVVNPDIGGGQDMSVVIDVPYAEWSVLFKPQNLVFFVLPLEFAFAFKWWFLAWILLIATYLLVLTISPRKYMLAALLALFFLFSPFIQWWYQSITILPIAYTFLLIAVAVQTVKAGSKTRKLVAGALITYLATCFILVMYPAFQVVCALVGLGLFVGIIADRKIISLIIKHKTWVIYAGSIVLAAAISAIFIYVHREAIQAITQTSYPGSRNINAGGQALASMTNWPLGYVTLRGLYASALGGNQSETSRFLLFGMLLIPHLIWVTYRKVNPKQLRSIFQSKDSVLLSILILLCILFGLRMFLPLGSAFYKLIGLHLVPHIRLVIGLGIINLALLTLAMKAPARPWRGLRTSFEISSITNGLLAIVIVFLSALYTDRVYQIQSVGLIEIGLVALVCGIVAALVSHSAIRMRYIGLLAMCMLGIASSLPVNPISRGMGAIKNDSLSKYVDSAEKDNGSYWIVSGATTFATIPLAAGAEVFSGVQTYPQLELWDKYFPGQTDIYNRYAHINFVIDDSKTSRSIRLVQADSFEITTPSCDSMLTDLKIDFIITDGDTSNKFQCFNIDKSFNYNGGALSVYSRVAN